MQRLRAIPELSAIPVVILSGRDRAANEMRAFRAGAAAFLEKPVSGDVLLETIQRCLGRRIPAPGVVTYSVEAAGGEKEIPVHAWAANVETR
jgi:DNA-binding response OmpR family regulator